MKKLQLIFIVLLIIIVIVVLVSVFGGKSEKEIQSEEKMMEINKVFNTWKEIAKYQEDKEFLTKNELAIKEDLFLKLNLIELKSLNDYSNSIKDLLSVKSTPLNPLFLTSSAYLISNFNNIRGIVGKTSIKDWFNKVGFSNLPNTNQKSN